MRHLPREPVAALCDLILQECVACGAQELQLAAGAVRMHLQGAWVEMMRLPPAAHTPVVNRLKAMAQLDPDAQPPQTGQLQVAAWGRELVGVLTVQKTGDATEEVRVRFPSVAAVSPH
jgi:type II secretory ATPase GspE/PulE/Tfp pilus assembly ATPase PilB-like protein